MFEKILIANRGIRALRIMRTCKELGIATVAVHSQQDADQPFVRYADEALCVGPADPSASYCNALNIMAAAQVTGAQAIHPGAGFLASSSSFARACGENGLVFIGPSPDVLGFLSDRESLADLARHCGVPMSDKAPVGGGKLRRVQIPVILDGEGNRVVACETDLSIKRKGVSPVQESPASFLSDDARRLLGVTAQKLLRALGYVGVAFVTFLMDAQENTYLESISSELDLCHGALETAGGIDLVREQILVAAGEATSLKGSVPFARYRHAIGFYVSSEDSRRDFAPCPGTIERIQFPAGPGVRVDSDLRPGSLVTGVDGYGLAQIIAADSGRSRAIARGRRALSELQVEGVGTTVPFHQRIVGNAAYNRGDVYTDFLESEMGDSQ